MEVFPEMELCVAVMVEVPIETAVARPVLALIVATPPAEEVHVAVLVRFWVLLSV